jgi:hypothetical protein
VTPSMNVAHADGSQTGYTYMGWQRNDIGIVMSHGERWRWHGVRSRASPLWRPRSANSRQRSQTIYARHHSRGIAGKRGVAPGPDRAGTRSGTGVGGLSGCSAPFPGRAGRATGRGQTRAVAGRGKRCRAGHVCGSVEHDPGAVQGTVWWAQKPPAAPHHPATRVTVRDREAKRSFALTSSPAYADIRATRPQRR